MKKKQDWMHGRTMGEQIRFTRTRAKHRLRIWREGRKGNVIDPVFVLATARSGSNLLTDLLDSVPGITMTGEILNDGSYLGLRQRGMSRRARLRHLRHSINALPGPTRGAKLLLPQLQLTGIDFDDLKRLFPHARVLVLYRESLAEQLISQRVAHETKQYRSNGAAPPVAAPMIRLDPDSARAFFRTTRARYQWALGNDWLRQRSIVVSYEELVGDPATLFEQRVCPFLGITYVPPSSTMAKQNVRQLSDIVVNWADVAELMTGPDARHHYT